MIGSSTTMSVESARPTAASSAGGLDLTSLWTLYVLSIRQHLRGKRWIVATLLFLLPSVLVVILRATSKDVSPLFLEFLFAFMFIPQALLPLIALLYASGVIQDEQEEQTITYLLIRPIPKWALYAIKMLATLTTTLALTAIFTGLTYAAIYFHADAHGERVLVRCIQAISVHSLSVIAYCCLFGLISLLTKRTLVVGILYAAIVEGLLANMPLSVRLITVIYYARVIAFRTMQFVLNMPDGKQNLAADAWQFDINNDPKLLEHPDVSTCLQVLLISSIVFTILGAFMCWRKEFYVKTPEKS